MKSSTKNKLAIIGTVGLPANYGGFETLSHHLVSNLSSTYDITVYCSGVKYSKEKRVSSYNNAKLVYIPLDANGLQSIAYDTISIIHSLFFADVLLILGVAGAWILPFVKLFTNKKIIISIDGIEWKREKWNLLAKLYLWWAEKIAVKYSHIDISDNESIQDYTAQRYGSLSRIIEYGADHVSASKPQIKDYETYPFLKNSYAIKVCRIEPENNIHVVLEAFAKITSMCLVIIGNWNNSSYGKNLKLQYATNSNIYLLDPIYEQKTIDMLRSNAELYIHGHSAGGTNPSLVEAMYLGLPVLSFGVSYNRTTTENKAAYFRTPSDIVTYIQNVSTAQLNKNSNLMKEIAHRRYVWNKIAYKYQLLIEEACVVKSKNKIEPVIAGLDVNQLNTIQAVHLQNSSMFFEKRNK